MKIILNFFFQFLNILPEFFFSFLPIIVVFFFLRRKEMRKMAIIGICMMMFIIIMIGNGFVGKIMAQYLQKNYYTNTSRVNIYSSSSVIVVLGGGGSHFNKVEEPHIISYSRLVAAYQLYYKSCQIKQPCKILVSGKGGSNNKGEAELFRQSFENMGVPKSDIIIENKSMNTYENAKYSSKLLHELMPSKVYLVTSGFHMKRAVALFHTFGISPTPYVSDLINTELSMFPNTYNNALTFLMFKEIVGIWQVKLYNGLRLNKA